MLHGIRCLIACLCINGLTSLVIGDPFSLGSANVLFFSTEVFTAIHVEFYSVQLEPRLIMAYCEHVNLHEIPQDMFLHLISGLCLSSLSDMSKICMHQQTVTHPHPKTTVTVTPKMVISISHLTLLPEIQASISFQER